MTYDNASATARAFTLQWTLSVGYPVFTDNDILLLISPLVFEIISAISNDVVTQREHILGKTQPIYVWTFNV